jgi:hypothetical protein
MLACSARPFCCAGTSSHASLPRAAALLGLVLALEGGSLAMTLALRPHISRIVTACEVVCSCLHVASTAMLLAAHRIAHGDASAADSAMQVGSGLTPCMCCAGSAR